MNINTFYFKKDIVKSREAFNELEKVRLNYKPTKKPSTLASPSGNSAIWRRRSFQKTAAQQ